MTKLEKRRAELERKVLSIFETLQDMPGYCEKGIGKYSIKRMLQAHNEGLKVSINTIKKIVDHFLDVGKIECVNPHAASGVRFRLRGLPNDSI